MVKAAAVGTAGIVGAMLMESEAAGFALKATGQTSTVVQALQIDPEFAQTVHTGE